jgi:hypothetical protein
MTALTEPTHRFETLFESGDDRVFRITFRDGDIFRLRGFSIVEPSIYGIPDQWNATIVEPISGGHPKFKELFHSESGVDFVESDILEIVDDVTGAVLYRSPE